MIGELLKRHVGYANANTYIQDGLVLHLDGKDKGNDPLAWTDLVNGIKFIYSDCILNGDSVGFDGKKSFAYNETNQSLLSLPFENSTIEVVYSSPNNNGGMIFLPCSDESVCFGYNGSINAFCSGTTTTGASTNQEDPQTNKRISFTVDLCLDCGISQEIFKTGAWLISTKVYSSIGARLRDLKYRDKLFEGKIYSIRLYDRKLNEEEMRHNQSIDLDYYFTK